MIYGIIKEENMCEMGWTSYRSNITENNKSMICRSKKEERSVQAQQDMRRDKQNHGTSEKSQQITEAPEPGEKEKALQLTLIDKETTRDLLSRRLRDSENGERLVKSWCEAARAELQHAQSVECSLLAAVNADALRVFELKSRVDQERTLLSLLQARVNSRLEDAAHERRAVMRQSLIAKNIASKMERAKLQSENKGGDGTCLSKIEKAEQDNAKLRSAIEEKKSELKNLQKLLASYLNTICVGEDEERWAEQKVTLMSLRDKLVIEARHRQLVVQALQQMYEEHAKSQHELKKGRKGGKLRRLSQKMLDLHRQICECDNQRFRLESENQRSVDAAYLELWLLVQQHKEVRAVLESRLNEYQMPPLPTRLPVWLLPPLPRTSSEELDAESAEESPCLTMAAHEEVVTPRSASPTSPLGFPTQASTPKLREEEIKTPPTQSTYRPMPLTPAPFTPRRDPRLSSLSPGSVYHNHGRPVLGTSWKLNVTS